jgi:hypothetical protein
MTRQLKIGKRLTLCENQITTNRDFNKALLLALKKPLFFYQLFVLWLASALFFFAIHPAAAGDVNVKMTVDQTAISLDDEVNLQVVISGVRDVSEPSLEQISAFTVSFGGKSSKISIINGQMTSETVFSYTLAPTKGGTFQIGPATVFIDGQTYQSNIVTVTVGRPAQAEQRDQYVTTEVDNAQPFLNEQIIYTFRFFNKLTLLNASLSLPTFEGFLKEDFSKQKEYTQLVNDSLWQVTELKYALYPTKTGEIVIQPTALTCEMMQRERRRRSPSPFDDPFFEPFTQRARKTLRSEPITVNVKPLPDNGKPADFSGIVGQVRLTASLDKTQLQVGDSATLALSIEGNGNMRDAQFPAFAHESFKIYDDEPTFHLFDQNGKAFGRKTFKKAIVPLKPGSIALSDLSASYFDPKTGRYHTAKATPIQLTVVAPKDKEETAHVTAEPKKKALEVVGVDMMPIEMKPKALAFQGVNDSAYRVAILLMILPAFLFIGTFAYKKRKDRYRLNVGLYRKKVAHKNALAALKELSNSEEKNFIDDAQTVLKNYLADSFTIDCAALTSGDVERRLSPKGIPIELQHEIQSYLNRLESELFSASEVNQEKRRALIIALEQLILSIENWIKK